MIQIKEINFIPKLDYAEYSQHEILLGLSQLKTIQKKSEHIWVVLKDGEPLVVVGVVTGSILQVPRLWFLICRCIVSGNVFWALRGLRDAVTILNKKYPKCEIIVEKGWFRGFRFARFCGFRPSSREVEILGRQYIVMER